MDYEEEKHEQLVNVTDPHAKKSLQNPEFDRDTIAPQETAPVRIFRSR